MAEEFKKVLKEKIKHKFSYYRNKFGISNLVLSYNFIVDHNFGVFFEPLLCCKFDFYAEESFSKFKEDFEINKDFRLKFKSQFYCDGSLKSFLDNFNYNNLEFDFHEIKKRKSRIRKV